MTIFIYLQELNKSPINYEQSFIELIRHYFSNFIPRILYA